MESRIVYILDTNTTELDEIEIDGKNCPKIRHSFKAIEKHFPVFVVTDRDEITWYVCDCIPYSKYKRRTIDIVLQGNILYDESFISTLKK